MVIKMEFEKPEGFDDWYSATLADCVAQGIVQGAIKRAHDRDDRDDTTGIDKQAPRG